MCGLGLLRERGPRVEGGGKGTFGMHPWSMMRERIWERTLRAFLKRKKGVRDGGSGEWGTGGRWLRERKRFCWRSGSRPGKGLAGVVEGGMPGKTEHKWTGLPGIPCLGLLGQMRN